MIACDVSNCNYVREKYKYLSQKCAVYNTNADKQTQKQIVFH